MYKGVSGRICRYLNDKIKPPFEILQDVFLGQATDMDEIID